MSVSQEIINLDRLFNELEIEPIIINDLANANVEDREKIEQLVDSRYVGDMVSLMPSCRCGYIKGEYTRANRVCPKCGTTSNNSLESDVLPTLWFRRPEGVEKLINPIILIMLRDRFTKSGFRVLTWLINPSYTSTAKIPPVIERIKEDGVPRGYNNFVQNFDAMIEYLFSLKDFKEKGRDYLYELIKFHRDDIFSDYIPLPNKVLMVIEKTNMGVYIDNTLLAAKDAVNMLVSIDKDFHDQRHRVKENRTINALCKLTDFLDAYYKNNLAPKEGQFRRHIAGTRTNFAFRAVATSISKPHRYNELHAPWGATLALLKEHIISKLLLRGMALNSAIGKIYGHIEKYDKDLHDIVNQIIHESRYGALVVICHRNPSLKQGSAQRLLLTEVKTDPTDQTVSISPLIIKAPNCDFDGDELNISLATDHFLEDSWYTLSPHFNIMGMNRPLEVSGNIAMHKPVITTISNWLDAIPWSVKQKADYTARELWAISVPDLIQKLTSEFGRNTISLMMDDGVVISSNIRHVIYSRYFWEMHKLYPQTPILEKHHVLSVMKGKPLNAGTHIELHENILKTVVEANNLITSKDRDPALLKIYEITSDVYREVPMIAEEYVSSVDIEDYVALAHHPAVLKETESGSMSPVEMFRAYNRIIDSITKDPELSGNNVLRALATKTVNRDQVLQCVAMRGYVNEVDGYAILNPIMGNYTRGMNDSFEYMAETAQARKALYFSEAPLEDAEYFARRLQQAAMTIEHVVHGDCGTIKYAHWTVKPKEVDEQGNVLYDGDLKYMQGKYYLDETTNKLKMIEGDDASLYGKTIKMRSSLYCKHGKYAICSTCYGGLFNNIADHANIGHLSSVDMTEQTTQMVLSTKHVTVSSLVSAISMSESTAAFFKVDRSQTNYILKSELKKLNPRITIAKEEAPGLLSVVGMDSIAEVNVMRISNITAVDVGYADKNVYHTVPVILQQKNRKAVITRELLDYIRSHKWSMDAKNNFMVDMSDWDYTKPLFALPEAEYSYSDHSKQIAKTIESTMKEIEERHSHDSPMNTLTEIFDLVNGKLRVNIASLEIIVRSIMITSPEDYNLPGPNDTPMLGVSDLIIKRRSLGPAYAYQDILNTLKNPRNFVEHKRDPSVLDVIVMPKEVVQTYRNR